jgi:uncharacterized membrane protein YphA (DoxX/SURF4 family)
MGVRTVVRRHRFSEVRQVLTRPWEHAPSPLITNLAARGGIHALRYSMGVIYLWFGIPKFWSGVSPADQLSVRTMGVIDMHTVPPGAARILLATMESSIGAGLIIGRFLPLVLCLQMVQMAGTLTPLIFFRSEMWSQPLLPTLEGQYILKNFVLISAGIAITATLRGGGLVSSRRALEEDRAEAVPWSDPAVVKAALARRTHPIRSGAEVTAGEMVSQPPG